MKTIPLTRGLVALVDDADYAWLAAYRWCAWRGPSNNTFYAVRNRREAGGARTAVYMHREIMGAPRGVRVDHVDGDGLNCTRGNMRFATNAENARNQRRRSNNRSGLKGASWDASRGRWQAKITVDGRTVHLGRFDTAEEAHAAYCAAARDLHGVFARTG